MFCYIYCTTLYYTCTFIFVLVIIFNYAFTTVMYICIHHASLLFMCTDSSEITVIPDDLTVDFIAGENTDFTITIMINDNEIFEGFHSFVLSLPTSSDYIIPREDDIGATTIVITDVNGE